MNSDVVFFIELAVSFLPFILFALIRVTWRLVSIEYEFAIEAGELTIDVAFIAASAADKAVEFCA